jgi:hypothetical protein
MVEKTGDNAPRRRSRRLGGPGTVDFYPMLRRLTLVAYYTSEAGATEELHFEIIPERHDGCAQVAPDKEA